MQDIYDLPKDNANLTFIDLLLIENIFFIFFINRAYSFIIKQ